MIPLLAKIKVRCEIVGDCWLWQQGCSDAMLGLNDKGVDFTVRAAASPFVASAICIAQGFKSGKCLMDLARIKSGAQQCAAHGLHRPIHERPGAESPSAIPDTALVQRPWQGTRERDGQERAGRLTASLMALGLNCTEAATSWSRATFYGHPAVSMGKP